MSPCGVVTRLLVAVVAAPPIAVALPVSLSQRHQSLHLHVAPGLDMETTQGIFDPIRELTLKRTAVQQALDEALEELGGHAQKATFEMDAQLEFDRANKELDSVSDVAEDSAIEDAKSTQQTESDDQATQQNDASFFVADSSLAGWHELQNLKQWRFAMEQTAPPMENDTAPPALSMPALWQHAQDLKDWHYVQDHISAMPDATRSGVDGPSRNGFVEFFSETGEANNAYKTRSYFGERASPAVACNGLLSTATGMEKAVRIRQWARNKVGLLQARPSPRKDPDTEQSLKLANITERYRTRKTTNFKAIAAQESDEKMMKFINRTVIEMGGNVNDGGGLAGIVPFFSGTAKAGKQTLARLMEELNSVANQPWSWLTLPKHSRYRAYVLGYGLDHYPKNVGLYASLDDKGYEAVVSAHRRDEMATFVQRVAERNGYKVLDEGGLAGLAPYHSGECSAQNYNALLFQLKEATKLPAYNGGGWIMPAPATSIEKGADGGAQISLTGFESRP